METKNVYHLLLSEYDNKMIKNLSNLSIEFLGWNDFILDLNTFSEGKLYDFYEADRKIKQKILQFQQYSQSIKDLPYSKSLLLDMENLEIWKKDKKGELTVYLGDLMDAILSVSALSSSE